MILTKILHQTQELDEVGAMGDVQLKLYGKIKEENASHFQKGYLLRGGRSRGEAQAASPRDEVLGPFDARLETCAVAAFGFDKSNPLSKRRGVHCMPIA